MPHPDTRPGCIRRRAPVLVALAVLLTGCGGGGSPSPATSPSAAGTASDEASARYGRSPSAGSGGRKVVVSETEFTISLSPSTFTPGTYTFAIANKGRATHALQVEGPGVKDGSSDFLSPGDATTLRVTLRKGTYLLSCPVANHKALGMQTKISVR